MMSVKVVGLDKLAKNMKAAPAFMIKQIELALGRALAMTQSESQRRTPVDTGLLRSSIGGAQGYSIVRGLTASLGTNIKYAVYVHENQRSRHRVGEAKFMEKGVEAALPFIEKEMQKVAKAVAEQITQ